MFLGLGWVAYLLFSSASQLADVIPQSGFWLAVSSLMVILSLAMNSILFYFFLNIGIKEDNLSLFLVLRLHFVGQLLRYLPGRLWGIVYQVGVAQGELSKGRLARANIDWMIFSLSANALVATVIILEQYQVTILQRVLFFLMGAGLIAILFLGGANFILDRFSRLLPVKVRAIFALLASEPLPLRCFLQICIVFAMSWGAYILGWQLLSKVFPVFSDFNMLIICAAYTLASVLGILSVITPAGLGVREASFIVLAGSVAPSSALAFFAVFSRVWLMAIDVLLCVLSLVFFRLATAKQ